MAKINIKGIGNAAISEVKENFAESVGFAAIGTVASTAIAAVNHITKGPAELALHATKKMIKYTVTNMLIDATAGAITEMVKNPFVDDSIIDVEISDNDIIDDDDDIIIE